MKPRSLLESIAAAAIAASIFVLGCGVKSPPVPPEQAVPERIVGLDATSEKNGVLLSWERPDRTAGGRRMRDLGSFEIDRAENTGAFQPLIEIPVTDQDRFQQQRKFTYLDEGAEAGASLSLSGDFLDPRLRTAAHPPTRPRSLTSCPSRRRTPKISSSRSPNRRRDIRLTL